MKNLKEFRRFVELKVRDEENAEVRRYMHDHLDSIAEMFEVSPETIANALGEIADDAELARKTLTTIESRIDKARDAKKQGRSSAAQASANNLASFAYWDGEVVRFDLISVLASCLTHPKAYLVFVFPDGDREVSIEMKYLIELERLERDDLTAFVSQHCLHVRWGAKGQLNFRSHVSVGFDRVTFTLPAREAFASAAE